MVKRLVHPNRKQKHLPTYDPCRQLNKMEVNGISFLCQVLE